MAKSTKVEVKKDNDAGVISLDITPIKSVQVGTYYYKDAPYVRFGADNLFPQKLIALADNSSIHAALLETLARWIAGDGLIVQEGNVSEDEILDTLIVQEDYLYRVSKDIAMFGGFYDNVFWNNGGKIDQILHTDFSTLRAEKINAQSKKIENFYYSPDWTQATSNTIAENSEWYKPVAIPVFNQKTFRAKEAKNGQINQIKTYKAGKNNIFYAEPHYLSALRYIDLAAKIAELHDSNITNGMTPSYHIHLFKDLSNEKERLKIEKGLIKKYGGSANSGKIMLTWSTENSGAPLVTPLQTNNVHEMYNMTGDKVNAEIIASHRVPTFLANIILRAGFTDVSTAMMQSIAFFQTGVVQPMQRVITNTLEKYLAVNGIKAKLDISNLNPVAMFGDVEMMKHTVTTNEYRSMVLGLEQIEGGDAIIIKNEQSGT